MLGSAVMVVIYSRLTDPVALLVAGAVMGFFVNGMLGGYGALISELYPTAARATAQNVLFNIGRARRRLRAGGGGRGRGVARLRDRDRAAGGALSASTSLAMWLLIPERTGGGAAT